MIVSDPPMGVLVTTARIVGKVIGISEKIYMPRQSVCIFSSGIHAYYKRLSLHWGMKFYLSKERAEANYRVLSKAAKHGLAPRCGGKFSFKRGKSTYHGFMVEVVPPANQYKGNLHYDHPEIEKERALLNEALRHIGIAGEYQNDLHFGNIGYTKEGKLVAIDLSCSTDEDE